MPDARASRKRQIQITPKPFRGSAKKRRRVAPGVRDFKLTLAEFRRALAPGRFENRVKMILTPAGDSIPPNSRFRAGSWSCRIR